MNIFVPHSSGMLTDHRPHGDGLVAYGFISRLAQRGHSIYVAAEQVEVSGKIPENVHLFLIKPRIKMKVLARVDYMLQVRALFRRIRRDARLDLIHQLNPVYTGVSLALCDARLPVVLGPYVGDWPRDPDAMSASRPLLRSVLHLGKTFVSWLQQARADAILLTTMAAQRRITGRKAHINSTFILPHGIDGDFFSPGASESAQAKRAESPVILFLANISERKGIFDLLSAFELLSPKFPQARLWIAGDGEGMAAAQAVASQLTAHGQISFLGRQSRSQTLELFRKAAIYCLPSHGEPYGMTVAEAMSCGRPVVATNAGGPSCLLDDEGGIRVAVASPTELAWALSELLSDDDRRAAMGLHNRQKVLATMTWDRVILRLEEIYAAVIGNSGKQIVDKMDTASPAVAEPYLEGRRL